MKKRKKSGLQVFFWAAVGFIVMYGFINRNESYDFSVYAFPASIAILAASGLLIVVALYLYASIQKTAKKDLHGDEEDVAEGQMYRQYSDASLSNNVAMIISLAALCLMIITDQPAMLMILASGVLLTSVLMSFLLPGLMKLMYPERDIPAASDKDYAEKLLEISDDGERHIMLGGLYKTYLSTNSLLFAAMLVLLFYSEFTGTSQLMGIFTIAAVLVAANSQYIGSIRNK